MHRYGVQDEDLGMRTNTQEAAGDFEDLFDRIRRKSFKKRRLGSVPFVVTEGSGGMQFRVQYFCNMKPASKPSAVWLEGKNNTQLKIESKYLCQETGSYLTADKIKTFVPYGGERVYITREEVKDLKKVTEKGKEAVLKSCNAVTCTASEEGLSCPVQQEGYSLS